MTSAPDSMAEKLMTRAGVDRLGSAARRNRDRAPGRTLSIIGVYGGMTDPLPMLTLFDKQIQVRLGQANVRRWVDDLMPLVTDDRDPLGVEDFATHRLPLTEGPRPTPTSRPSRTASSRCCSSRRRLPSPFVTVLATCGENGDTNGQGRLPGRVWTDGRLRRCPPTSSPPRPWSIRRSCPTTRTRPGRRWPGYLTALAVTRRRRSLRAHRPAPAPLCWSFRRGRAPRVVRLVRVSGDPGAAPGEH